jgi:hypothetical protein
MQDVGRAFSHTLKTFADSSSAQKLDNKKYFNLSYLWCIQAHLNGISLLPVRVLDRTFIQPFVSTGTLKTQSPPEKETRGKTSSTTQNKETSK